MFKNTVHPVHDRGRVQFILTPDIIRFFRGHNLYRKLAEGHGFHVWVNLFCFFPWNIYRRLFELHCGTFEFFFHIILDQDGRAISSFSVGVQNFSSTCSYCGGYSYSLMAASSSKARARPIPRDLSSSEDSSQDLDEILAASNIQPRQLSLLAPRLPRLHSIKGPFQLVLGGVLTNPPRSRTRKTEFKLIERLPDILRGQFKFLRDEGPIYRTLTLTAGTSSTGAWRKVFASIEYPRLVFKLSPATEDLSYTTEEIRAFRQIPDYTAQFIQEFHSWISLLEPNRPENEPHRPIQQVHFHFLICERLIPYGQADLSGLDPEEVTYRLALAVTMVSKRGFRLKDCGRGGASASGTAGSCNCY